MSFPAMVQPCGGEGEGGCWLLEYSSGAGGWLGAAHVLMQLGVLERF
jgi:hypothetical protein